MAVSCLAGAFNTGTGILGSTIDVTGSITISGVSAVILFFNGRVDSTDAAGRATRWRGMGFAVGATDRRCQVSQDADAQAAHTGGSYHSDAACIASVGVGTATDGLMDFDSWLSNGFRLIVDDVMPSSLRVGYLIITGLDNAATGQWQDSATTGDKIITTGLSFQPDCEILLSTTIDTTPPGGRAGNEMMGMGFAVSTTLLATLCGGADEGSTTTDTDSYANDVECLSSETAAAGTTLATQFTFVSHNANGFTLNQAITPATIAWNHFLALKGGSYTVKSVVTQTDTTTDINTSALGFTPAGLLLISAFKTEHAAGTMTVHDTWSMGVASGVSDRFACSIYSQDGVADTVVYTAVEHDEVYVSTTNAAVEGLMDVKTWSDPITFIMDDADPSAKFVSMLVIGNVAAGETNITPAEATQAQASDAAVIIPIYVIASAESTQAQLSDAANILTVITSADAVQVQTSDAANLVVTDVIAPSQANQAQVSDLATLTVTDIINPAQSNQAQVSDAAVLSGPVNISVAEGNQAQVSDAATIAAIYTITPAQANQAQVSDAATLSQATAITPAQANQIQVSDAAIITTTYLLTPGEAAQAQTSDAGLISFTGPTWVIAPAQANQAQFSDAASILFEGPTYVITPAEGSQAQSSDALAVTYVITVADSWQAQVSDAGIATVYGVVEYGKRKLHAVKARSDSVFQVRSDSVFQARPVHSLQTRADLEVDDDGN